MLTDAEHQRKSFLEFIRAIPLISPKASFKLLEKKEYKGQIAARKSLCLAAYRHVRRIKKIHLENLPRESLPPKNNILMLGPTGCGKTFLVELLFRHILQLPTVIVDMTGFSETGYVGDDTRTILTRLILAAEGNAKVASIGIACMDEFDKLASTQSTIRFDGQGTTKDVSGYGVQRELLKMLEDSEMDIPCDFNNTLYSEKTKIFTGDISFIACGAFSSIKMSITANDPTPKIGFGKTKNIPDDTQNIAYTLTDEDIIDTNNFQRYGFIPELIGRFNRVIPLYPLDKKILKEILISNVIKKFKNEFFEEGIELEIEDSVLDMIVEKSLERQTGARSLGSLLTQYLENLAFDHFCDEATGRIILTKEKSTEQIISKWEPEIIRKKSKSIGQSI